MEIFNKEAVYDNEISPLMRKIIEICNREGIPMLASFMYENCPEKGIGHCTTLINDIDDRKSEVFQVAARQIKGGGHHTFSMAISSSN